MPAGREARWSHGAGGGSGRKDQRRRGCPASRVASAEVFLLPWGQGTVTVWLCPQKHLGSLPSPGPRLVPSTSSPGTLLSSPHLHGGWSTPSPSLHPHSDVHVNPPCTRTGAGGTLYQIWT